MLRYPSPIGDKLRQTCLKGAGGAEEAEEAEEAEGAGGAEGEEYNKSWIVGE
ncbi:MAG: hypothetical protein F6J92_05805 [Symploca sp. SIO1A3]|nr:hypothetical protein [Symploca sp. SIO1A3]